MGYINMDISFPSKIYHAGALIKALLYYCWLAYMIRVPHNSLHVRDTDYCYKYMLNGNQITDGSEYISDTIIHVRQA